MSSEKNVLEIDLWWTVSSINGFKWLNQINNAFNIDKIKLFFSDNIHISSTSIFTPSKILVFLWHHLYSLDIQWKEISITLTPEVYNFINRCWFAEFINTKKIPSWNLPDSVIFPFARISSQKELKFYLDKFKNRIPMKEHSKYELIDYISEIQYNSIEHWKTQDIYIMWQTYPQNKEIEISLYDAWKWMIRDDIKLIIEKVYENFSTKEFYDEILNTYWLNIFFSILCVCTQFSSKWLNEWGLWLWELSKYLHENKWKIEIATDKLYINLKFKKICGKIDLDSIELEVNELDNFITWTYISFTFSI